MSFVFVVDTNKQPLNPVHPGKARLLLKAGKAAVLKRYPFTIVLKTSMEQPQIQPLRLKLDPGSRTTGIALVDDQSGTVLFAAELSHRGSAIKKALDSRRAIRHSRRARHTRYRKPRFANRRRAQGGLAPSLMSRVCNVLTGNAIHKPEWIHLSDAEIILAYNGEFRGLANYDALAVGVKATMSKLEWLWKTSLLKTLANKHKTSVNKIVKRLKTEHGLVLTLQAEHKNRYIRVFGLKDLKMPLPKNPQLDVLPNTYIWTLSRSEITKRLNRKVCEYCGTKEGSFEVHHIRKLKDVAKGKELWKQMMAARHRKTLVLCRTCHHRLHAGTLPDKEALKKDVEGEPCARKRASTVLRGGVG
ncbi:MAG TPA: RNA-guided endonuclease IscB [Ktedonobacteraceae bacterium]